MTIGKFSKVFCLIREAIRDQRDRELANAC